MGAAFKHAAPGTRGGLPRMLWDCFQGLWEFLHRLHRSVVGQQCCWRMGLKGGEEISWIFEYSISFDTDFPSLVVSSVDGISNITRSNFPIKKWEVQVETRSIIFTLISWIIEYEPRNISFNLVHLVHRAANQQSINRYRGPILSSINRLQRASKIRFLFKCRYIYGNSAILFALLRKVVNPVCARIAHIS